MSGFRNLPTKPRQGPRVGTITAVEASEYRCTALLQDGEVTAYFGDQLVDWIGVGATVTLLPIGDTYEVMSTRGGGSSGGVGATFGPELLPNPSFEYGADMPDGWFVYPWVTGDWSAARDTTPGEAVNGSSRMLVTLRGGDVAPIARLWNSQAIRVDAGASYQVAAWVKAPAGDASLTVTSWLITAADAAEAEPFGTGAVGEGVAIATVTNPGGAYQLLTGIVTVPTGHRWARAYFSASADATIAAPVVVSWDAVSLRQRITS